MPRKSIRIYCDTLEEAQKAADKYEGKAWKTKIIKRQQTETFRKFLVKISPRRWFKNEG